MADYSNVLQTPGQMQTRRAEEIVFRMIQKFSQLQVWRNTFAAQWEEVAAILEPNQRNTFYYGSYNYPGQKKTHLQVDATGMMANHRFGAILDSLLTPRNMYWHGLEADDEYLKKNRQIRMWFEQVRNILFKLRYAPIANFAGQNQQNYQQLGAFGTGTMFVDQAVDPQGRKLPGFRYKALPLGEVFLTENHQGLIDGVIRWFRLTARQAKQKWPDTFPVQLQAALEAQSEQTFDFLHCIEPRQDYDPERIDHVGKPFASYYISLTGRVLLDEGGYNSLPIAVSRYTQAPGEVYGRSPAMMVLPALKTLNAEKTTFLKQGHRAADPVLLTADDGLVDVSLRPGAINKGGMSIDGKPLIGVLPTGQIQTTIEMMTEERNLVNDAFLVSLFQILTESPQMTATEVVERTNEKGILLAPTVGRQQSEYLGPLIDRELDLAAEMGLLPPMPPALREAMGHYQVQYTSPLSRAMRAQEVAGYMRTLESTLTIVNATQDPSILDNFAFDRSVPEIAEIQAVPVSWMATDDEIAQKRKARADQQQQAAQIQALPAQAAMVKAQATVSKAGGGGQQGGMGSPQGTPGGAVPGGPQGQQG